ncbi:MAG: hypothetical protein ACLQOO_13945 [Terriglobia bacterium]
MGKEEAMLAAALLPLSLGKEGDQWRQPFLSTTDQVRGLQGVGQLLQSLPVAATQKGIGTLPEADAALLHLAGQPVMLVQAETRGEGEVGADTHEHRTPVAVVEIEMVWVHPARLQHQVSLLGGFFADADENAGRLAGLDDSHDLVGLGASEIGLQDLVAALFRGFQDGDFPFPGTVLHPVVVLGRDLAQQLSADRILVTVSPEETHHPRGLLEGLDGNIERIRSKQR